MPPFFFITAFASVDRAVQMLKLGAADYVTKPFDIGELVSKVCDAVGVAVPVAAGSRGLSFRGLPSNACLVCNRAACGDASEDRPH